MKRYEEVSLTEAVSEKENATYMLVKVSPLTTIGELRMAEGYVVAREVQRQTEKSPENAKEAENDGGGVAMISQTMVGIQ